MLTGAGREITFCFSVLLVISVLFSSSVNASLEFWNVIESSNTVISVQKSGEAQEGEKILLIDGSKVEFKNGIYKDPIQPKGYVSQTVLADDLIGKHFHISGFAKSYEPNLAVLKKRFRELVQNESRLYKEQYADLMQGDWFQESMQFYQESFNDWLERSNSNADYGVFVLLYFADGTFQRQEVQKYVSTSRGKNSKGRWNRFNVEVSVPDNCKALSLVLWSEGLNIVGFDDFAIVEQGRGLVLRGVKEQLSDRIFHFFEKEPLPTHQKIMNLSFE